MKVLATKGGHFKEFTITAWRTMPDGRYGWIEVSPEALKITQPSLPDELIVREHKATAEQSAVTDEPLAFEPPLPPPTVAPEPVKKKRAARVTAAKRGGKR